MMRNVGWGLAALLLVGLAMVAALDRQPLPEPPPAKPPFSEAWQTSVDGLIGMVLFQPPELAQALAILIAPTVKPVRSITIRPEEAPAPIQPVDLPRSIQPVPPLPRARPAAKADDDEKPIRNACAAHGMWKVWVNKRRWRCRK